MSINSQSYSNTSFIFLRVYISWSWICLLYFI